MKYIEDIDVVRNNQGARMYLKNITFEDCPKCQSNFINQIENENPTWQCTDCLYIFEIPLIAKFPDLED
jgi:ribosomal protein L37AE/L43A